MAGCSKAASVNFPNRISPNASVKSGNRAGNANAERGIALFCDIRLAVGPEENICRRRVRRGLAVIDRDVLMVIGGVDHHETAAADVSRARIGHRHRKPGSYGRVHRIAATSQHVRANRAAIFSCATTMPCSAATARLASAALEKPDRESCARAGPHSALAAKIRAVKIQARFAPRKVIRSRREFVPSRFSIASARDYGQSYMVSRAVGKTTKS